jgi:hypothetical protein
LNDKGRKPGSILKESPLVLLGQLNHLEDNTSKSLSDLFTIPNVERGTFPIQSRRSMTERHMLASVPLSLFTRVHTVLNTNESNISSKFLVLFLCTQNAFEENITSLFTNDHQCLSVYFFTD